MHPHALNLDDEPAVLFGTESLDEASARLIAQEARLTAGSGQVACIACPAIFAELRAMWPQADTTFKDLLVDPDPRFQSLWRDNVMTSAIVEHMSIPLHLRHRFTVVVADACVFVEEDQLDSLLHVVDLLLRRNAVKQVILLASDAMKSKLAAEGFRLCRVRPRTRGSCDVRVYASLTHARNLQ
jgi:hypothetical protein